MNEANGTPEVRHERKTGHIAWRASRNVFLVFIELWFPRYQIKISPSPVRKLIAWFTLAYGMLIAAMMHFGGHSTARVGVAVGVFSLLGIALLLADRHWTSVNEDARRARRRVRERESID